MSHEIRTSMSGVPGMAYLALQANPGPRQRDYLEKISQSGQHLLGSIKDRLDFSKMEADKLKQDPPDFALGALFKSIVNQQADSAQKTGRRLGF